MSVAETEVESKGCSKTRAACAVEAGVETTAENEFEVQRLILPYNCLKLRFTVVLHSCAVNDVKVHSKLIPLIITETT